LDPSAEVVESDIPARLDALPWARFHTLVVVALGITWVLDGLEVTLAGAVSGALKESPALHLADTQVGLSASAYLAGAVLGALFFGWLADLHGRKRLFFVTLGVYIAGTAMSAASPSAGAEPPPAAIACLRPSSPRPHAPARAASRTNPAQPARAPAALPVFRRIEHLFIFRYLCPNRSRARK